MSLCFILISIQTFFFFATPFQSPALGGDGGGFSVTALLKLSSFRDSQRETLSPEKPKALLSPSPSSSAVPIWSLLFCLSHH